MFEDSVFESRGLLASPSRKWTTLTSLTVQGIIVATVAVLPILRPDALQFRSTAPKAVLLAPAHPPKPPEVVPVVRAASSSNAMEAPATRALVQGHLSRQAQASSAEVPTMDNALHFGGSEMPQGVIASAGGTGPIVRVAAGPGGGSRGAGGPLRISAGVLKGLLIAPIRPVYPQIAVAAHVEGAVVVEAVISRAGMIESAHVISGPAMLAGAALEAIRTARYQPFLLNGQPTEVATTITVNFRLGG